MTFYKIIQVLDLVVTSVGVWVSRVSMVSRVGVWSSNGTGVGVSISSRVGVWGIGSLVSRVGIWASITSISSSSNGHEGSENELK